MDKLIKPPRKLTLGEASKKTGMSKTAIAAALKSGRISGNKNSKGVWQIEPSELYRVYPKRSASNRQPATTPNADVILPAQLEIYETMAILQERTDRQEKQIAQLEKENDHLKQLLEKEQQRTTMLLGDGVRGTGWWDKMLGR